MAVTPTTNSPSPARKAWRDFLIENGKKLRNGVNGIVFRFSKVGNPPVFDTRVFPWTKMLEEHWEEIRDEALAVLEQRDAVPPLKDISPDHARLAENNDKWQSFFIWGYGYKMPSNAARCPRTTALVEQIPGLKSAFYSIFAPGAHIPSHRGVTAAMITCHLALIVPKERDKCRMQVDDQMLHWEPGKTLVFDDTFRHEVWNDTAEDRVILLVQFARPLRFPGNLFANFFLWLIRMSPFVQDAKRAIVEWDKKLQTK